MARLGLHHLFFGFVLLMALVNLPLLLFATTRIDFSSSHAASVFHAVALGSNAVRIQGVLRRGGTHGLGHRPLLRPPVLEAVWGTQFNETEPPLQDLSPPSADTRPAEAVTNGAAADVPDTTRGRRNDPVFANIPQSAADACPPQTVFGGSSDAPLPPAFALTLAPPVYEAREGGAAPSRSIVWFHAVGRAQANLSSPCCRSDPVATAMVADLDRDAGDATPTELVIVVRHAEEFECLVPTLQNLKPQRLKAVRLAAVNPLRQATSIKYPAWSAWALLPGVAQAVRGRTLVMLGPGTARIAHGLLGALAGAEETSRGVDASRTLVDGLAGCSVHIERHGAHFVASRGLSTSLAGSSVVFTEPYAGFSAAPLDSQLGYALNTEGVAPSPYCFSVRTSLIQEHWTTDVAFAADTAPGTGSKDRDVMRRTEEEEDADGPSPLLFIDFESTGARQSSKKSIAGHVRMNLHSRFLAFALAVAHAAVFDSHPNGSSVPPVVTVPQGVLWRPLPDVEWEPTWPTQRDSTESVGGISPEPALAHLRNPLRNDTEQNLDTRVRQWLRGIALPPATAALPAVVWDTFCVPCFGFSNEVMHFAVPLEGKLRLHLSNHPDCFCPGTPRSFSDALTRLAAATHHSKASMVSRWGVRETDAPSARSSTPQPRSILISHKDPGSFPSRGQSHMDADIVVGRAMYEFNVVPPNWAGKDHLVDEIWVPCRYVRWVFEKAGFDPAKLVIVPEPVDVHQYDPEAIQPVLLPLRHVGWTLGTNRPGTVLLDVVDESTGHPVVPASIQQLRTAYKFLSVFKWESRKAWDALLRAYFTEFDATDDVSLYIVSYIYGDGSRRPHRMMADAERVANEVGKEWPDGTPHVEIISEQLSEADLISLYRSVDAFVLPTRGEGWGLPIIQAMAMGLPSIATNWSGNVDFMTGDTSYLLPTASLEPLPASAEYGTADGKVWAKPDETALRRLLRQVQRHPIEARAVGARARTHVAKHYSSQAIAALVVDHVRRLSRNWGANNSRVEPLKDA